MIFLTLISTYTQKPGETVGFLKRVSSITPPPGISVLAVYMLIGRYDGAILFEAPDEREGMNFILKIGIPGGFRMETLVAVPPEVL